MHHQANPTLDQASWLYCPGAGPSWFRFRANSSWNATKGSQDVKVYTNGGYPNHMQQWLFLRTIMNNLVFRLEANIRVASNTFWLELWNSGHLWSRRSIKGKNWCFSKQGNLGVHAPSGSVCYIQHFVQRVSTHHSHWFCASSNFVQVPTHNFLVYLAPILSHHRCVHLNLLVHVHTPCFVTE